MFSISDSIILCCARSLGSPQDISVLRPQFFKGFTSQARRPHPSSMGHGGWNCGTWWGPPCTSCRVTVPSTASCGTGAPACHSSSPVMLWSAGKAFRHLMTGCCVFYVCLNFWLTVKCFVFDIHSYTAQCLALVSHMTDNQKTIFLRKVLSSEEILHLKMKYVSHSCHYSSVLLLSSTHSVIAYSPCRH